MRPRLGRIVLSTFTSQALAGVLKVGTTIVAARVLGPADFGQYMIAIATVLIVFNLGNLGISPSATYHVARADDRPRVARDALAVAAGLGVGAAILALVGVGLLGGIGLLELDPVTLVVALCSVPAYFLWNAILGVLLGVRDYRRFNAETLAFYAVTAAGVVAGLAIAATPRAALAGWTVGSVLAVLIGLGLVAKHCRSADSSLTAQSASTIVRYGGVTHLATIAAFLNYRVDLLLVGAFIGSTQAGFYAASVGIAETLWFFSVVSSTIVFSQVAGESSIARRRSITDVLARLVFWGTTLVAVLVAITADRIVDLLYTDEYRAAVPALRIALVGIVALSVSRVLANYVAGIGRPGRNIPGSVVALAVNLALNVVWIPIFGIEGAAAASAVAYMMALGNRVLIYGSIEGRRGSRLAFLVPRRADLALLASTVRERRSRRDAAVSPPPTG